MAFFDILASVIHIIIMLQFILTWMIFGRASFLYCLPPDTKRNRLLALIFGPLFVMVSKLLKD